jgi:hypothetical protein
MDNVRKSRLQPPKLKPIARRRRNYVYLLLAILLAILTLYIVKTYPPFYKFPFKPIEISIVPIFFIVLGGFLYTLLSFIFIKKTQAILITFFIILYFILRLLGLTHWAFGIIIILLFVASEYFILLKK